MSEEDEKKQAAESSRWWLDWRLILLVIILVGVGWRYLKPHKYPEPRAVPYMQVVPQPYDQASFQRNGVEIARYYYGKDLRRPFIFPIIGPSGRCLTRMGHPWEPETHSHHNSVWISHNDVDGVSFWADNGNGRIVQKKILGFEDGGHASKIVTENDWIDNNGKVLMTEKRQVVAVMLLKNEWMLIIDMQLSAAGEKVTLGKTPFGMIGVRMAKSIGVYDGGGRIRNSEGGVNEKEVLWKRAKWVDYSGPVTDTLTEGITLFDYPENPNFPNFFHVRNDGWMGVSLTYEKPMVIEVGKPLHLRYGLYVHSDMKPAKAINSQFKEFAAFKIEGLETRPKPEQ